MQEQAREQLENFYSGLSGLALPVPKYAFPEGFRDKSRLSYYASLFNSIEINSTFYKLPLERTVDKWVSEVPEHFRFTFKLWKEITHCKAFEFTETDVAKFFNVISHASLKKGTILIQLPPSLGAVHTPKLEFLLNTVRENSYGAEWPLAVEFRNRSWYTDTTFEMLEKFNAGLVVQDIPKSTTPMVEHRSNFVYVRFHGPTGNYRDSYSESFLAEYATYIKEWLWEGKTVYAYFNNTMGDAFKNLQTLNDFVVM